MRPGALAGVPVSCLLPEYDLSRLVTLGGDPQVNSIVSGSDVNDVGRFCGMLLSSLNPRDRRKALHAASANVLDGEKLDIIPLTKLLPGDCSIRELSRLWNGLALLLLSMGTSAADTSVGTVTANAASMAAGVPFASDPLVGERQNEVLLAKAILEAALLGDEEAKQWFQDNKLSEALSTTAAMASGGKSDASDELLDASDALRALYDCAVHNKPLGGDASIGDVVSDFFKNAAQAAAEGVSTALDDAAAGTSGQSTTSKPQKVGSAALANARERMSATAKKLTGATQSPGDPDNVSQNLTAAMEDSVSAAREALSAAKSALEDGAANVAEYKEKLKNTALKSARLEWADAILGSGDDVAAILAAATPNMADPGSFLQSMLATLPAAKETGNLGTIKALVYALRSAASKGDGSASALYSLISGDPSQLFGRDDGDQRAITALGAALATQRSHILEGQGQL